MILIKLSKLDTNLVLKIFYSNGEIYFTRGHGVDLWTKYKNSNKIEKDDINYSLTKEAIDMIFNAKEWKR